MLYKSKNKSVLIGLIIALGYLASCQSIGRGLGSGAVQGVKQEETDKFIADLVNTIVLNARNELLGDTTRQLLDSMLQEVTGRLNTDISKMTTGLRDSLLNEYTTLRLKQLILDLGEGIDSTAGGLRDNLLGARTRLLIARLRNELLGDSTLMAVAGIRDELLGPETQAMVDSLLKASITRISVGFDKEIKPQIKEVLQTTEKSVKQTINYAAWALGILAVVLAVLIALLWRKFSTRRKIMRILTQEIDKIEDQSQYDRLVANINKRTTQDKLEPAFQKILKSDHLYQQSEWKDKDKQLLKTLSEDLEGLIGEDSTAALREKLDQKGLKDHYDSVVRRKPGHSTSDTHP